MADTRCQLRCEEWVRQIWMPQRFQQTFHPMKLPLASGGLFSFDAVSDDRQIAATISTSGANTSSMKRGAGKLYKLRSDMLFLGMASVARRLVVLTEQDMFELCRREQKAGRVPTGIEFHHAELPAEMAKELQSARCKASEDVTPADSVDEEEFLRDRARELTPANETLLNLSRSRQPPQSWWDDDTDPFVPEGGK